MMKILPMQHTLYPYVLYNGAVELAELSDSSDRHRKHYYLVCILFLMN